jgi:signal transduction histidine kinase
MELVFDYTRSADPVGPLLECLRVALVHELSNQFVAIQGLTGEAGLELDASPGGGGARELLARVGAQARRANRLCRRLADLIALSREAPAGPVRVDEVAREAAVAVRLQFPDRPPEVHVAEGLPELTVPPRTLYHVYIELMRYAVAGSPRPVRIAVGGQRCPGGGTFWVADDGPGFPGERPEQFFEPFVHLPTPGPATPSSANPGETGEGAEPFGLGLFLVRQAVACWHGRLHVRSEPGRGTTFTFFIPHGDDAEGGRA